MTAQGRLDVQTAIGITVGVVVIVSALVGAGIAYGQHVRADEQQDARILTLEQRVSDLERADAYNHGDTSVQRASFPRRDSR